MSTGLSIWLEMTGLTFCRPDIIIRTIAHQDKDLAQDRRCYRRSCLSVPPRVGDLLSSASRERVEGIRVTDLFKDVVFLGREHADAFIQAWGIRQALRVHTQPHAIYSTALELRK